MGMQTLPVARRVLLALGIFLNMLASAADPGTPHVALTRDNLVVDGERAPYLFGASLQYFRARGGDGRNVDADKVLADWNKLLDAVVGAKMNLAEIYVPWDFHEPVEGSFDFTGSLDRDGDKKPDYPSRNLKGFLDLVVKKGIRYVIIRPGPYINAEWGREGFGAIPPWFIDNHQDGLMKAQNDAKAKTGNYAHPTYQKYVKRFFEQLYSQVLKDYIGPGKPIVFVQLDNETNFFWDSVYERDYGDDGIARYRAWLEKRFGGDITALQRMYNTGAASFDEVVPPAMPGDSRYGSKFWHYDWFEYHDRLIADYHRFLRTTWENLGVREPDVIFTTCESFNTTVPTGLLPRLDYRGRDRLALTTLNVYPKTDFNLMMKAAHDAALLNAGHRQFYGPGENWLFSTETQGGWFAPIVVSDNSRMHTYGSLLSAGAKAMNIYYLHGGWNWDSKEQKDTELKFDAPLDKDMKPRSSYALLQQLGKALAGDLGEALNDARPPTSHVLLAHDTMNQYPLPGAGSPAPGTQEILSNENEGLYGFLREAGAQPDVAFIDALSDADLKKYRLVVWHHAGSIGVTASARLSTYLKGGGSVLWIGDGATDYQTLGDVVVMKESPAKGWNSNDFPAKVPAAGAMLAKVRALLDARKVARTVRVYAVDGKPFLQGSVRRTAEGRDTYLFVENFLENSRSARVGLASSLLPEGESVRFRRVFSFPASEAIVTAPRSTVLDGQVVLPVSGDSLDIWKIELPDAR